MNALTYFTWLLGVGTNYATLTNMFYLQLIATCVSLCWLLGRSAKTLWKPVPELISVLGVEVPEKPAVSLAGIKCSAITLQWTRPPAHKPVTKYLIQVNGVNVGESSKTETAIEVTGLKPGHFYNVRVIAVGSSNFQTGSDVIRLRTSGKDGRPLVGSDASAAGVQQEEDGTESGEETAQGRGQGVGIHAASLPESAQAMAREPSGGQSGQRRNTLSRRHSPSAASLEPGARDRAVAKQPEDMSLLTERWMSMRKETDEIVTQRQKDDAEFRSHMEELTKEKDDHEQILKDKKEATDKLKKDVGARERLNKTAQNRKAAEEGNLKRRQDHISKMQEDMATWKKKIERMTKEREEWRHEKEKIDREKHVEITKLTEKQQSQQLLLSKLDEEIRLKGLQIQDLIKEQKALPGNEEEDLNWDRKMQQEDLEWSKEEGETITKLNAEQTTLNHIHQMCSQNQGLLTALQASVLQAEQASNAFMNHGEPLGVEFEPASPQCNPKPRRNRKSRTSTISSPVNARPNAESPYPIASEYNGLTARSPTWAQGPYIDNTLAMVPLSEQMGMSDEDVHAFTGGAPLSPTATSLLPSKLFADDPDDEPPSPRSFGSALRSGTGQTFGDITHSPNSSTRSASLISSPQNSSQNLAMYGVQPSNEYTSDLERRSTRNSPRSVFGAIGSPTQVEQSAGQKFKSMLGFPKRGKTMHEEGPALGSLKQSQSHSFPRSTDEPEDRPRHRRTSFTAGFQGFLRGSSATESSTQGNAPAPARNTDSSRYRAFKLFHSSIDDPSIINLERDPSSPRPVSIASQERDLPRPSTDSAPFGWGVAQDTLIRNSPLATNWSVTQPPTWSRNPSRRPSIQHNSTSGLGTGIASDDDEFLPPSDSLGGQASPPPVGVIGTRPVSSHKPVTPKLNPAAPAFKGFGNFIPSFNKADKEKDKAKVEGYPSDDEASHGGAPPSPLASRKSRNTPSIRTIASSLAESHDSLEIISSNTPSEPSTKDSALGRLLRSKNSTGRFSISGFSSKSLFAGKKASGSSAGNSDRNASVERDGSFDEYGEDMGLGRSGDSVTSSPMIGVAGKESGTPKEGRMGVNWGRLLPKKSKGKESLDVERSEPDIIGDEA